MSTATKTSTNVRDMALIAVMSAVCCVVGPLSVPIGLVPVTLTNLAIYFAVYLLGHRRGTASVIIYLLLGTVGMPVFSGFSGGFGKLLGPTGGYLIGFIFMAFIGGFIVDKFHHKFIPSVLGLILGTAICYAFGTVWLAHQAGMPMAAALAAGVIPFIPADLIKIAIAAVIAPQIRSRLAKAGICPAA